MDKVVFLDRDGVIDKAVLDGYVESWDDFEFLPHSLEAIKLLTQDGYRIFIASNQSGVAKDIYTMRDLDNIDKNMKEIIQEHGGKIEGIVYCPHRDEDECSCRKPRPGLFDKIIEKYSLDVDKDKTFYIGDSGSDIEAGKRFGLKTILLLCGKANLKDIEDWYYKPDYIKKDLLQAVREVILKIESQERIG